MCCVSFCESAGVAYCCAIRPFVALRNSLRDCYFGVCVRAKVYEGLEPNREEIPMIIRHRSKFMSDEHGMFLQGGDTRIYLDTTQEQLPSYIPFLARNQEERKETLVARSKFYKTEKLPDFQGQFLVDDTIIGHFSRIKFNGRDCYLTAYHVLDYNRNANVMIAKNDKKIVLSNVPVQILAFSPSSELDYLVMEVPSSTSSLLGLKIGKFTEHIGTGQPISVFQIKDKQACVTMGSISKSDKPWTVKYGASTLVGSSGAPLLDKRNGIVGVHVEGGISDGQYNVGVVPPILRKRKETHQVNDVGSDWDYEDYVDDESGDDRETFEEFQERLLEEEAENAYHTYVSARAEKREFTSSNWASQMDEFDEAVETMYEDEERDDFIQNYKVGRVRSDKPLRETPKRGYSKESPWTCSRCATLHLKHGSKCVKCGYALIPGTRFSERMAKQQALETVKQIAPSAPIPDVPMRKIVQEVERDRDMYEFAAQANYTFSPHMRRSDNETVGMYDLIECMKKLELQVLTIDKKLERVMKDHGERCRHGINGTLEAKKSALTGNDVLEREEFHTMDIFDEHTGEKLLVDYKAGAVGIPYVVADPKSAADKKAEAKAKRKAKAARRKERDQKLREQLKEKLSEEKPVVEEPKKKKPVEVMREKVAEMQKPGIQKKLKPLKDVLAEIPVKSKLLRDALKETQPLN